MEPELIPYSPIRHRPVLRWPNGARVALWVVPNVEHYEFLPPVGAKRDPWPRTPAQLTQIIKDDYAKWQKIIRDANIKST